MNELGDDVHTDVAVGSELNSNPPSPRFVYEGDFEAYSLMDGDENSDWLDLGIVDVEAETESKRQEAEARLRTKSNELKRFHDKICTRVTERERENRLEAQRAQNYLDAKCAKVFSATESTLQTGNAPVVRISTRPYFQQLKKNKNAILKNCPLGQQIDQIIRLDAQMRDDLLRSTEISRSENYINGEREYENPTNVTLSAESPVLLPEQRVALYATVRRQYMEMNRAKIQKNVWRGASKPISSGKAKSPLSNSSIEAAVRGSRARRTDNSSNQSSGERCATSTDVKVIDMTSSCDVRVHRQTTTSSTPWREKTVSGSSKQVAATEHERFLRALRAQLGTPALCSCVKAGPNSGSSSQPCANNCALYKQPKKREKLLASVYKQQQLDTTTTAASPIR
ncbi:hypothetical protein PF005_g11702 [Phytophthora fragariae]|uniref:Uncharacterized protein n=1 Tax=Phytophthora fragariae TaxID=53985 RepID=A0A6A3Z8E0_9STRA|nr:hypothetical protein PF009_g12921 [Phytophthora fragariae]KAE9110420.1 hypothetical protein PF007_g11864 [Phytophthora fragariae]KAE9144208.1 hypothetical protein PF006_g10837 [Phytophthora fragariae]KAE9209761.1 hypothetical protein PF005_g11702 [Phytophthora fragariae]KAE9230353.1 hypothetical protein PF002_g13045 [Phytophthora fragariae]